MTGVLSNVLVYTFGFHLSLSLLNWHQHVRIKNLTVNAVKDLK